MKKDKVVIPNIKNIGKGFPLFAYITIGIITVLIVADNHVIIVAKGTIFAGII